MLVIKNLVVSTNNKNILKGVSLAIRPGEIHALMGPNGAGKTSLALALMGSANYQIPNPKSQIIINKKNITKSKPEERAREGLFVAFQSPIEVTGVSVLAFLRTAYKTLHPNENIPLSEFKKKVSDALVIVGLPEDFMQRSLNEGFSGGEKKRAEVAQLLVLEPKFAVLDEIDSGLDVDSLGDVAKALSNVVKEKNMGILLITHYQRILHYIKPDMVHVLINGKIAASDGMKLVERIERKGYQEFWEGSTLTKVDP